LQTHIGERLLLAQHTLVEQVVRGCDIVVPICFNALDRIVWVETKLIENLLIDGVFYRHQFLAWEQARWLLVSKLSVPGVLANLRDTIPIIWVRLQDFRQEV